MIWQVEMLRNVAVGVVFMFFFEVYFISNISEVFSESVVELTRCFTNIQNIAGRADDTINPAR